GRRNRVPECYELPGNKPSLNPAERVARHRRRSEYPGGRGRRIHLHYGRCYLERVAHTRAPDLLPLTCGKSVSVSGWRRSESATKDVGASGVRRSTATRSSTGSSQRLHHQSNCGTH